MGEIVTFYSYKGGVGRSMALANIAVLLNKWGYKVLAVDWDLEAPGLEYYFKQYLGDLKPVEQREGIIDILDGINRTAPGTGKATPRGKNANRKSPVKAATVRWRDCTIKVPAENIPSPLELITAGKRGPDYFAKVRDLDLETLYAEKDGGLAIEAIRNEWKKEYDFALVDSRTGITDVGGVCTVQLPDILALVFTANTQSLKGIHDVSKKVLRERQKLPFDRLGLACIPIASKFDTREEFNLSQEWLKKFAEEVADLYANWLPADVEIRTFLEISKIPYTTYFSFGEKLPVVEQGTTDPTGLGYAYETLAALIAHRAQSVDRLMKSRDDFVRSASNPTAGQHIASSDSATSPTTALAIDVGATRFPAGEIKTDVERNRVNVFISGTARDLPDHREAVRDACLRLGMFPRMVEQLPARDADATRISLDLLDGADIYLGILGVRYGYMPKGHKISITEMEYDRAREHNIPRLIFLMHEDHPIKLSDVETGVGAERLAKFRERLKREQVVHLFHSPEDLRAQVIAALSDFRPPAAADFHKASELPVPPEPYIVHAYLPGQNLVGRQDELKLLTDWVMKRGAEVYQASIFNIVAIGGMGKSALAWHWFNEIAPRNMTPLAGQMWWSFYETGASWENFVVRALAYFSRKPREEAQKLSPPEREQQLLTALDREPFLVALDGLERLLIGYAHVDGATAPDEAGTSDERLPRRTVEPRAGGFLKGLARVRHSKILLSTRLYPADLQTAHGEPIPGCVTLYLKGLTDNDALALWRQSKAIGSRDELLKMFHSFDNHPLLIQLLAGEVANFRRAPGDFDKWRKAHADFNPLSLPPVQSRLHVLEFALQGLAGNSRRLLDTISLFRMPAKYEALAAILVGKDKPFRQEKDLDASLAELEGRGVLRWDRQANRYDVPPVLRAVVRSKLDEATQRSLYTRVVTFFESLPTVSTRAPSLEDLTGVVELYNALIGLGQYDSALTVFRERLYQPMLQGAGPRPVSELLEMLFPNGLDQLPSLADASSKAFALGTLAMACLENGQPGRGVTLYQQLIVISEKERNPKNLAISLANLSYALLVTGRLRESATTASRALSIARELGDTLLEASALVRLGVTQSTTGETSEAEASLEQALRMLASEGRATIDCQVHAQLSQRALWLGDAKTARKFADRARKLAETLGIERDLVRAVRLQGAAALALGDLVAAEESLLIALASTRAASLVEDELPSLVALAELRRRQGDLEGARKLLTEVWAPAKSGPYPLFQADALNVLSQVERDAGPTDPKRCDSAIEAATQAYHLAWRSGPPFAYHWGLEAAREHLIALGEPEPRPLVNASEYTPTPAADVNAD
jgi:MinD-like ATPase involved in chromosome partitioning or flagellar assembly/tetratricopeptide (TPR) repeat protein